jgi:hypothetical protein
MIMAVMGMVDLIMILVDGASGTFVTYFADGGKMGGHLEDKRTSRGVPGTGEGHKR